MNYSAAYKTAVADVARSLVAMVQNIPAFLQQCIQRRYPPMVDEICQTFFIPSPVVQKLMFVWVRNEMSIPDDQFANLMMDEFIRGQNWHTELSKRINTAYPPTQREIDESTNYTKAQYLALRDAQVKHYASNGIVQLSAQRVPTPQSPVVQVPSAALNPLYRPASVLSNHNVNGTGSPVLASPSMAQQQLAARGQNIRRPSSVVSLRGGAMASMQSPSPVVTNMPSPAIQSGQFVVATTTTSRQGSFSGPTQQQNGMMTPHMNGAPQYHHHMQQNQPMPTQQQMMSNMATPPQYELMRRGHQFQQHQPTPPQSQPQYQMAHPLVGPYDPQKQQRGGPKKPLFWHPANAPVRAPHLPNPDVMALHYADLRSPTLKPVDRKAEQKGKPDDRYYQVVKRIVAGPAMLRSQFYDQFEFALEEERQEKLPTHKKIRPTDPDLREIKHGSLVYRIRCVKLAEDKEAISDSEFVVADTTWPRNITIEIAGKAEEDAKSLNTSRKNQWGKDLPIDITRYIADHYGSEEKEEKVQVNVVVSKIPGKKEKYVFAIEEIEVARHDVTVKECLGRTLDSKTTEDGIKKMLNPSTTADDDDIVMGPSDLNIGLQDPWLAKLWNTPVKGQYCLHRECFDLDTFLETRPQTRREKSVIFHDQDTENAVVSAADVWKCPLCEADARPVNLRVDEWMQGVKAKLVEEGRADEARTIVVSADASWKVRDEEARKGNMMAESEKEKRQAEEKKKKDVVVIDLDDD